MVNQKTPFNAQHSLKCSKYNTDNVVIDFNVCILFIKMLPSLKRSMTQITFSKFKLAN